MRTDQKAQATEQTSARPPLVELPLTAASSDEQTLAASEQERRMAAAPCGEVAAALTAVKQLRAPAIELPALRALAGQGLLHIRSADDFHLPGQEIERRDQADARLRRTEEELVGLRQALSRAEAGEAAKVEKTAALKASVSGLSMIGLWLTGRLGEAKEDLQRAAGESSAAAQRRQEAFTRWKAAETKKAETRDTLKEIAERETALLKERETYATLADGEYARLTPSGSAMLAFMEAYGESLGGVPYEGFSRGCRELMRTVDERLSALTHAAEALASRGFHESQALELAFLSAFHTGPDDFVERSCRMAAALAAKRLPLTDFPRTLQALVRKSGDPQKVVDDLEALCRQSAAMRISARDTRTLLHLVQADALQPAPERIALWQAFSDRCRPICRTFNLPPSTAAALGARLVLARDADRRIEILPQVLQGLLDRGLPRGAATAFAALQLAAAPRPAETLAERAAAVFTRMSARWGGCPALVGAAASLSLGGGPVDPQLIIVSDIARKLTDRGFKTDVVGKAFSFARSMYIEACGEARQALANEEAAHVAAGQVSEEAAVSSGEPWCQWIVWMPVFFEVLHSLNEPHAGSETAIDASADDTPSDAIAEAAADATQAEADFDGGASTGSGDFGVNEASGDFPGLDTGADAGVGDLGGADFGGGDFGGSDFGGGDFGGADFGGGGADFGGGGADFGGGGADFGGGGSDFGGGGW